MLAHEIKNPLSGIRGAAQLLEQSANEDDRLLTRLICDETDRIVKLVERMELFGEERPSERGPVNVHGVLDHVKRLAQSGFARHIRFVENYDPSLPPVLGNRDQLIQVVLNLVKNAAEAIGIDASDGEIVLSTAFRHRRPPAGARRRRSGVSLPIELSVTDNGPGIPPDLVSDLFDPFVTTKAQGSGLGLALVAKIVGDHGGIVECDPAPRRTTFRILLPMHRADDGRGSESMRPRRMPSGQILLADDDAAIRTVLNQALSRAGYEVRSTSNAATLWRWVAQGEGDLVITDVVMPDENAFDLLPRIKKLRPDLPIIVMSAQNTFMTAIKASERGAYEYLPKPFDLKELVAVVGRALVPPATRLPARSPHDGKEEIPLVGRSQAMQEIYRALARLMPTDLTVMITGESGTGKELVAKALHDYGKRRQGPFVAVNMAAIPRELIESELFGHEKGAFTGATARNTGRFEQAEGGTLFLDEIGDMPMEAQTRLLRVLQQGEYTTVGGRVPIKTNVRIVAATNKDLRILIQQGLFREDLFFRLNVVPLRLPPLRERVEDIPDLARHFFALVEKEGLPRKQLDRGGHGPAEALSLARQRSRARKPRPAPRCPLSTGHDHAARSSMRSSMPSPCCRLSPLAKAHRRGSRPPKACRTLSSGTSSIISPGFKDKLPPPGLYHRILREIEGPLIGAALAATRGNQIRAAELLGSIATPCARRCGTWNCRWCGRVR